MLTNFNEITVELSTEEHEMVDVIIARFKALPGRENVVTNTEMLTKLNERYGLKLKEPRIRKIIQFIRINNLLPGLIGTSSGYYYTENIEEIEKWILSMQERERAIAQSRQIAQNHVRVLKTRNAAPGEQPEIPF